MRARSSRVRNRSPFSVRPRHNDSGRPQLPANAMSSSGRRCAALRVAFDDRLRRVVVVAERPDRHHRDRLHARRDAERLARTVDIEAGHRMGDQSARHRLDGQLRDRGAGVDRRVAAPSCSSSSLVGAHQDQRARGVRVAVAALEQLGDRAEGVVAAQSDDEPDRLAVAPGRGPPGRLEDGRHLLGGQDRRRRRTLAGSIARRWADEWARRYPRCVGWPRVLTLPAE